jgi:hypothetical protein
MQSRVDKSVATFVQGYGKQAKQNNSSHMIVSTKEQ